MSMFGNFFKVIYRHLVRSKFFAVINISGLAIGIASAIVIYLYVHHELSFDRFHTDRDNIYRVIRQSQMNGTTYEIGVTSGPFAPALTNDYPDQIKCVTRTFSFHSLITFHEKSFMEEHLMLADRNFFQFFSYPLAKGNAATVLSHPENVVVTKSFAKKYFDNEDPIGKILRMDNKRDLIVSGVLDDLPGNTHLKFDLVGSTGLVERESWFSEWWSNSLNTYIKASTADAVFLCRNFPAFMDKYFGKDFERAGNRIGLSLEPLSAIHFNSDTRYERGVVHGDKKYVFIFGTVGILLIVLASINYMNLATAQASRRAKEVSIRKTLGSAKSKIITQFLSESFVLCILSILAALAIVQLCSPLLQSTFGLATIDLSHDPYLWIFLVGLLLIITVLAGSYPSFILSSFQPVKVLKGEVRGSFQYLMLRKALVVFQFGISIFMIVATLVISLQLNYMSKKDLGFNDDQILIVRINNPAIREKIETFKNALMAHSEVQYVSMMSSPPGGDFDATSVHIDGMDGNIRMRTLCTDENFARVLDLNFIAGRCFSQAFPGDRSSSVILNETAVRLLGWQPQDAIGKRVIVSQFDSVYKHVIGVVEDYHFTSLKEKIEPLVICCADYGSMFVKLSGTDVHKTIVAIKRIWNSYGTGFPMESLFLDEAVNHLYRQEVLQGKVFMFFSLISVFIACLGILGLTAFLATQRKKEIGIRKVLGANTSQLSFLLMKDMMVLVLVANVIAIPIGYFLITMWLESFAYRISLNPAIFMAGGLTVFIIALAIVGLRAVQTALENPVKALRTE